MLFYCPDEDYTMFARTEVYRTTGSEAHQAHLWLMLPKAKAAQG